MGVQFDGRRSNIGFMVFSAIVISFLVYFTFAALQGEHGLLKLIQIEAHEVRARAELAALKKERIVFANRTRRLSGIGIDLEILDEQARRVLGLSRPDEILFQ